MKRTVRTAATVAFAALVTGMAAGCQSAGSAAVAPPVAAPAPVVPIAGAPTRAPSTWTLSTPDSVLGLTRIQPSASMLQTINTDLRKGIAPLSVTGTPVVAVYDDPKYDVYIVFAGINGTGFDPTRLTTVFTSAPHFDTDGTGDRATHNDVLIDPGPHGGTAGCASELIQSGALAAESTVCSWMTPTTLGSITYIPKPDHRMMVTGTGPEVLGPVMRNLRDQVEQRV